DDDTPAGGAARPAPPATPQAPPFRAPITVTADSAKLFTGPCEVVMVPHGLFLESVPYRPFLYVPVGSAVEMPGRRSLAVTLADDRPTALDFSGRDASRLAEDTAAFLARERGVPDPRDYRRAPRWVWWLALIFAAGLGVAPLAVSWITDIGVETGLRLAAGFAGFGLLANAAVVLFTRSSVFGKGVVVTVVGGLGTGGLLLPASAS